MYFLTMMEMYYYDMFCIFPYFYDIFVRTFYIISCVLTTIEGFNVIYLCYYEVFNVRKAIFLFKFFFTFLLS